MTSARPAPLAIAACLGVLLLELAAHAEPAPPPAAHQDPADDDFESMDFVIVADVDSYRNARALVDEVSRKTAIPVDLRKMKIIGGELRTTECPNESPCFWERGRADGRTFLSIEPARGYPGPYAAQAPVDRTGKEPRAVVLQRLTKYWRGKFAVVAAHGKHAEASVSDALKLVQRFYPQAELRTVKVFIGCTD